MLNAGLLRALSSIGEEDGSSPSASDLFGSKEYARTVGERLEAKQGYSTTAIQGDLSE